MRPAVTMPAEPTRPPLLAGEPPGSRRLGAMSDTARAGAEMATRYDPQEVEPRWAETWVERGYFTADPHSGKEPYCIVHPAAERHRARCTSGTPSDRTLAGRADPPRPDAGVRGALAPRAPTTPGSPRRSWSSGSSREEGIDRREMGREAFVERVWAWKEKYGDRDRRADAGAWAPRCDWTRQRFTMDEGLSRAVRVAFVRLYEGGLIYRGRAARELVPERPHGAVSDSEVEHDEVDGELVTFRYPLSDGSGDVDVATTRVETMLGDTGIAVHPDDERYAALVGHDGAAPVHRREIPIVADDARRPGVRHRRRQGHARARPDRLRDRQRHGTAADQHPERDAHVNDAVPEEFRGPGPLRGPRTRARGAGGAGADRRGGTTVPRTRSATATAATRRSSPGSPACSGS